MHGDNALTSEAADTLLKRGLRKSACGEGFVFTRDLKNHLKGLYGYPFEIWSKFAESIQCPHLIITAATQPEYFQAGEFDINKDKRCLLEWQLELILMKSDKEVKELFIK